MGGKTGTFYIEEIQLFFFFSLQSVFNRNIVLMNIGHLRGMILYINKSRECWAKKVFIVFIIRFHTVFLSTISNMNL